MIGLDFANERFVRVYTRDTEEWLALSWQAQGLYWAIRRKVDRSGLLVTKRGPHGVSLLVGWPGEVVADHLPQLIGEGFVVEDARGYLIPEFIPSEETSQSVAQRQRESRARKIDRSSPALGSRDEATGSRDEDPATSSPNVTNTRDQHPATSSPNVTKDREAVTLRDEHPGRLSLLPSALPSSQRESSLSDDPDQQRRDRFAAARRLVILQEQLRREIDPECRPVAQLHCEDAVVRLLILGNREEDLEHVLRVYAAEARAKPGADRMRWFNGVSNWTPDNVGRAKGLKLPAPKRAGEAEADGYHYPDGYRKAGPA